MRQGSWRRGFTVTEAAAVGVVVAVGASVVAQIGPGRICACERLAGMQAHRRLGFMQQGYMLDHDMQFSGPNTSGLAYRRIDIGGPVDLSPDDLAGTTTGDTPTSLNDWISPIASYGGVELSPNRARRMQQIFNCLGDRAATRWNDEVFATSTPDLVEYLRVFRTGGYAQVSFLQSAHFVGTGRDFRSMSVPGDYILTYQTAPTELAEVPDDYFPTLDRVGSPSVKVMHADGTRYLSQAGGGGDLLDFDASLDPASGFGSFADRSPIADGSTAYGRNPSSQVAPGNLDLSFRQVGGGMHATMFDGSVRLLSREEAWTDPVPWLPSGSVWNGDGATPESDEFVAINLPGGVIP